MDVDNELEGSLLQQFSCLGTTDRDVLIGELQKLLGNQLNATDCAFFLDMNNWNLQAAVCSYFDFEASKERLPSMQFLKDVTVGEGEAVPPNTKFVKSWRIRNSGETCWPPGCSLKFTIGDVLGHQERVLVDKLVPHCDVEVSVEMISPPNPGIYQSQWRMSTPTGQLFGEVIWVIVTVAEGGLMAVTQQMDAFHQLGAPTTFVPDHQLLNPFGICNGGQNSRAVSEVINIPVPACASNPAAPTATSAPLGSPTFTVTSDASNNVQASASSYPNENCFTWSLSPTQRNTKWKSDC